MKAINDILINKIYELDNVLSKNYVHLDIVLGERKFKFTTPLNKEEERYYYRQRKSLIRLLLQDAARQLVKEAMYHFYKDDSYKSTAWDRIDYIINNCPDHEQVQSPIDASSYEEIKVEAKKAVDLNYDSYQVKQQDPKLNEPHNEDLANCGCGFNGV